MASHPGSIDRHGNQWRIRLCVGGKRHVFKLDGDTSQQEVEQHAREKATELHRRNGRGLPGPMPVSELLDRFTEVRLPARAPNTRKTYGHSLTAFRSYFVNEGGDPKAHEVRPGHVQGFLHWRREHSPNGKARSPDNPVKARTLAKDRAVLHAVFTFAETLEVVQGNPVRTVTPPKGDARQPVIINDQQLETLLAACEEPMLRMFVLFLAETGARCESEASFVRFEDIDIVSGRDGHRTKSGRSRAVPLTSRLREDLRDHMATYRMRSYRGGKRSEWVFHHLTTRRTAIAGERIKSLRAAFAGAVKRAGLPRDLNQHDLRHRRVTTWLAAGRSPVLVQKAMGHSDLQTTMRYTHLVADDLLALVELPEEREVRGTLNARHGPSIS